MWKRAVLCHNSGAGKNDHRGTELLEALSLAGIKAEYCSTDSDDFPAMLDTPADLIVAAGGDGTVGKVAKYLGGRDVPLGILPVGTANNIARSFGIFGSPHEIAEGWRKDQFIAIDIPMATIGNKNRLFAEAIGLGLFSEAIGEMAGRGKGVGKLKAARERLREMLAAAEAFEARLDIDGRMMLDGEILALEVMNIAFAGPGLSVLSTGDMCRGLLHTMVFREKSREKMLAWLKSPQNHCPPVPPLAGKDVRLSWRSARLHIDDKVIDLNGAAPIVRARVDGTMLKVLKPGHARTQ